MQITVNLKDQAFERFGNALGALGDGQARVVMSRALNHEADKARTLVKRTLAKQTGIRYGRVDGAIRTKRSLPSTLTYMIEARGDETNIGAYKAMQRQKGVSAAPWNMRRIFPHTFLLKAVAGIQGAVGVSNDSGGRLIAFVRIGKGRRAIRPVFGPNLARELVKAETKAAFELGAANILPRLAHEIARVLDA